MFFPSTSPPPPSSPSVSWDLTGSYFLSSFIIPRPCHPQVLQAVTEGLTFVGLEAWAKYRVSIVCPPPLEELLTAGMWQGKRFAPCFGFPFVSESVSACAHTGILAGVHPRGRAVVSQAHRQIELWIWGGRYVLGEGSRRTTALCADEVNRQVRFLCSLLLKASFYFSKLRGARGHERLD